MGAIKAQIKCCDKDRESLFCPDCGKKLRESHDLRALVHHLRQDAKKHKDRADSAQKCLEARQNDPKRTRDGIHSDDFWEKKYKTCHTKLLIWTAWADEVERLVNAKS